LNASAMKAKLVCSLARVPKRLKPTSFLLLCGTSEVVPFPDVPFPELPLPDLLAPESLP
jgi:hypothetical protein